MVHKFYNIILLLLLLGETKAIVKASLSRGPKTVQEFKFAAADEGMMVHDLYQ